MSDRKIQAIQLTQESIYQAQIGQHRPVTIGDEWIGGRRIARIEYRTQNMGDHGHGWFDVYCGNDRVASYAEQSVGMVLYQDDTDDG